MNVEDIEIQTGMLFLDRDATLMEVVKPHEKRNGDWWCRNYKENVGLWAYSQGFIKGRIYNVNK